MKCSETWLREWVNPSKTREKIADLLTMAGLEVESCEPVSDVFSDVIVGQIIKVEPHPDSDRLHICDVNTGDVAFLKIVCGAPNVIAGMKVPVASINAKLPNDLVIKQTEIRGVQSHGMLCSASDLGISNDNEGLMTLPSDAPVGADLWQYLQLNDHVFDVSITPNRGDCLSVRGLAREIVALTDSPLLKKDALVDCEVTYNMIYTVAVHAKADCPSYVGRVIRNVNMNAPTPIWLSERLRRSGIRSINPIVDVTNYVMLELGQPMHAFDLDKIQQGIHVRHARAGESIKLLDGSEKRLENGTLIISDEKKPLAIAGVMGGIDSGVTRETQHIFLESAFFQPTAVAKSRQQYNLVSESAYRFERGVDPTIQREAIIRATQLIKDIAGGEIGPVIEVIHPEQMPKSKVIGITTQKVSDVLGLKIEEQTIESVLRALSFPYKREQSTFAIKAPTYRFDVTLPEDIIEEIARLYGYHRIPTHPLKGLLRPGHAVAGVQDWQSLRQRAADLGYHEVVTYSFVDKQLQALLDPDKKPVELVNPISSDMAVMRTNLWSGLMNTLMYNQSRQQNRVKLYEMGVCFNKQDKQLRQETRFGGLISGTVHPEQWGDPQREVDFFDLKGDVEALLQSLKLTQLVDFRPDNHPALHPGQSAAIFYQNQRIGRLGAIHPSILQTLGITKRIFVYELDTTLIKKSKSGHIEAISKFPEIRRDLAILVNEAIPARQIQDTIKVIAGDWLKDVFIFDVYQGKGIAPGLKSVALAIVWQHPTRTLIDEEVNELVNRVTTTLNEKLGAALRR